MLQETGDLNDVIVKLLTPKVRSLLREAGKTVAKSQDFYLDTTQRDMQMFMEDGLTDYMFNGFVFVEIILWPPPDMIFRKRETVMNPTANTKRNSILFGSWD